MKKKENLSIQMNEKLNEYLDEFVKKNGLKKSRLIEELLKKYVESKSLTDDEVQKVGDVLCRVAQLIQGWNTSDSDSAWSEWDKSVYEEVIELQKYFLSRKKFPTQTPKSIEKRDPSIPRRIYMPEWCEAEKVIYTATQEIEKMGADVRLTDAVNKLSEARELVADYVDGIK